MKRFLILLPIIFMLSLPTITVGQKTISNPKVILDTTYNGDRFIYTWSDGYFITQAADSVKNDSVYNKNYFSLTKSNVQVIVTKKRIVGTGDTLIRRETIQMPFLAVYQIISNLYTNAGIKAKIITSLQSSYKKKISQE